MQKEFQRELKQKLPKILHKMEKLNTAPVDIAQSSIGPGMEIFSQAESVLNPNDSKMTVREALVEINSALAAARLLAPETKIIAIFQPHR